MNKGYLLTTALLSIPLSGLMAQGLAPDTLLSSGVDALARIIDEESDESDFSFTESQLDEDVDAAQTIVNISTSNNDLYLSKVGFLWSAMRFKVRAYDNMYSQSYINGMAMNDLETGRFNYSMLGGLNDATRNREGASAFDNNNFGLTGIGGGDNINLRASSFAQSQKVTLSGTNRNYKYRGMYTFGTGLMNNGWALAGTIGYRGASEGVIEGTYYNSFSYLLAAEKVFNDQHRVSIVTFGAPTERSQQAASTEEAYWLANSHYYNPNWGYQGGKKRNARVVNDFSPVALLTWDWLMDDNSRLTTNLLWKYSRYSTTALGWTGEAYDPRPDYYKNLPSSIFNVYDDNKNNAQYLEENPYLHDQWNTLYDYWTGSKANRQIDWDRMYYVNRQNEAGGGEALYYQERRHNDQLVGAISTTLNKQLNRHNKLTASLQLNATKGMHYTTMEDLLGGTTFTDINKFAANDYGKASVQAQSDVRRPNRQIKEGDIFGYNYNTEVYKANLWAEYLYTKGAWNVNASGHLEFTAMQREGLFMNGQGLLDPAEVTSGYDQSQLVTYNGKQYVNISYGESGFANFLGGGARVQAAWRPVANHRLSLSAGYDKKAPLVRNAFVAPRVHNNYVDNLTLEDIFSGELTYQFRLGDLRGRVAGYYTKFMNQVEQTAFYNDAKSTFTYLTMSEVDKQHYGVELALSYQLMSNLSVHATGTISEAEYTSNPYAQLSAEGMNAKDNAAINAWKNPVTGESEKLRVMADGMHVGSTPLTALSFGARYSINSWFFEANVNWYDRVFIGFSQYRRLTNIAGNFTNTSINEEGLPVYSVTEQEIRENGAVLFDASTGAVRRMYGAEQEKFHPGWMLDFSIGKSIRLKHSRAMSINLSVQNATNNENLRTGGYEQNRDDYYYNSYGSGNGEKGLAKTYKFSKNSKYYYANQLNAFLNVNYRF